MNQMYDLTARMETLMADMTEELGRQQDVQHGLLLTPKSVRIKNLLKGLSEARNCSRDGVEQLADAWAKFVDGWQMPERF